MVCFANLKYFSVVKTFTNKENKNKFQIGDPKQYFKSGEFLTN